MGSRKGCKSAWMIEQMTIMIRPWKRSIGVIALLLMLGARVPAYAEPVTLNFQDADIQAVIDTVGKITNKNFVIDPRVKGKVTVVSPRPLNPNEVYQVFLSILEVHGYAAVQQGSIVKIVPDVNARQSATPVVTGSASGSNSSLVTRVIRIDNVPAAQLVPVLRPLVPQNGQVAAYPESNSLIISDTAANVDRLAKIIASIDRPTYGQSEIVPLQHAGATDVVRVLKAMSTDPAQAPSVVADERTNSVILGGDPSQRTRLRAIINRLDTDTSASGNTHVAYLKYANARDLMPVLQGILGLPVQDTGNYGSNNGFSNGGFSNSSFSTNGNSGVSNNSGINAGSSGANSSSLSGGSFSGSSFGGNTLAGGTQQPLVARTSSGTTIQAYEAINALVITGSPDQVTMLKNIIRDLDIRRPQVMVDALIVEITANKANELGLQWLLAPRDGKGAAALTNFTNSGLTLSDIASALVNKTVPTIPGGLTLGGGNFDGKGTDFGVILRALISDSNTNVLSTPTLLTLDNEEAEIVVGQNVPFITGSFTNTGTAGTAVTPFQTIQRQDVGLTLKIKPQINDGGVVQMNVEQEVSSISNSVSVKTSDIVTDKRAIRTSVLVDNGQVIVLGGLIDDQIQDQQQRVPLLASIPIFGHLFRYDNRTTTKRNLMVFLRPSIMRVAGDASDLTLSKYRYIRDQQLKARGLNAGELNGHDALLPPYEDANKGVVHPESSNDGGSTR